MRAISKSDEREHVCEDGAVVQGVLPACSGMGGTMAGALSIPFAFLALFNVPGRLLFAGLAYAGLWVLIIAQARRISELQKPVPSPNVTVRVGRDLIDDAWDFDAHIPAQWIRGSIKNIGDRGVERCRLKLLDVEGQNIPPEVSKVKNGFLQWESGIRDSMRLNPGEYWIFDIGTRADYEDSPLVFAPTSLALLLP
jgi:hypothetical protein